MQAPAGTGVAAGALELIIHCVATRGYHLFISRGDCPTATVNCPTFFNGLDLDGCAIYLFSGLQLLLIGNHCVFGVKAAAGSLGRSRPTGVILGTCGRHIRVDAAGGRSDQCNSLPAGNGRLINVGVVVAVCCKGGHAAAHLLEGTDVTLRGNAVRIVGNDPTLHIVVCSVHGGIGTHQAQTQLTKSAPNVDLIAEVIAGRVLCRRYDGCVRIIVGGATVRLSLRTVGAAVCFLAIKPNEPRAIYFLHTGDFACFYRRFRASFVGAGSIGFCLLCSCFTFQMDNQVLFQTGAIRGSVAERHGEIVIRLDINASRGSRCFLIAGVQQFRRSLFISGRTVIVQQDYIFWQDDLRGAAIRRIFHLHKNRHDGERLTGLPGNGDGQAIRIQRLGIHIADGVRLVIVPVADTDFGVAGSNGKTISAHIATCGRIRKITIQHLVDFFQIGRRSGIVTAIAFTRNRRVFNGRLHGNNQSSERGIRSRYCFVCLFLLRKGQVQIFSSGYRGGCFIRDDCSFIQCCNQIRIFLVLLPGLACQRPAVDCSKNALSVKRIYGGNERLSFGAQFDFTFVGRNVACGLILGSIQCFTVSFRDRSCALRRGLGLHCRVRLAHRGRLRGAALHCKGGGCGKAGEAEHECHQQRRESVPQFIFLFHQYLQ